MAWKIIMPKLGMTMKEGRVVQWLVKEGDRVEKGQVILQIESDKIQFEVEAPDSGILAKILINPSEDSIPVGTVLALVVEENEEFSLEKLLSEPAEIVAGDSEAVEIPRQREMVPEKASGERIKITPVAKKLAQGKGVDLALVKGTGPGGRITREDVEKFLAAGTEPRPGKIAEEREDREGQEITLGAVIPLSRQRRIISQRLTASYSTTPHIYLFSEIEVSELKALRNSLMPGIKIETGQDLSYNDILIKVVASAIVRFPLFNSTLEGENIRIWKDINIGLAVATNDGLIVPVVKTVQSKSLKDVVVERAALVDRALNRKLTFSDVEAGTFTISNLGMFGVDYFTAIINPPQTAILTVGRMVDRACVVDGAVKVRSLMQLGLAADHRVVDGALGASFLQDIKVKLEKVSGFLS